MGTKVEPLGQPPFKREIRRWKCIGPCMISFGIPLLIPGVTLTCVALSSNTGLEMYTGLHITGYIFLAVGILLLFAGCIFYNTFRIKVGPLPVVLMSQVDLRLSYSQRIYLQDKPTFFIRTNSAKPSTCFQVQNETAHSKNNFRGTGKVSTVPGQYNKHGEPVNLHDSRTEGVSKTAVSTSMPTNPERSDSTVTSEESTSCSESESGDSTSSSGSSTATSSSDSSLTSVHNTNGSILTNKHIGDTGTSHVNVVPNIPAPLTNSAPTDLAECGVKPQPINQPTDLYFSQSTNMESIEEVDSPFTWENVHLSEKHLLKRANEDVKSEELKPALMKSIAWFATEGNTNDRLDRQEMTSHRIWPNRTQSSSVDDYSDDVDGGNIDDGDGDADVENDVRKNSSDSVITSSSSTVFSHPEVKDLHKTSTR